ncbi:polyribonucleotide nucleotidyltransferase [candidate division WOR-3 bacterium]|nr:polyribonucleotide nucleotidyltransferase [candidate division WOR-3 bacterium]
MPVFEFDFYSRKMVFDTGNYATQSHGSIWLGYGDSVVLVTACFSKQKFEGDYFPLMVDYRERSYSFGRIPGGYSRREAKSRDKEVLTSRLIDRPIRPLFPEHYKNETQIIATVLSADPEMDPDILGLNGASLALCLSPIPFMGPIAAVRLSRVDGQFIVNPTYSQIVNSDLSLVVAGNKDKITMLEGSALEIKEEDILEAIKFAQNPIKELISRQEEFLKEVKIEKITLEKPAELPQELAKEIDGKFRLKVKQASDTMKTKEERAEAFEMLREEAWEAYKETRPDDEVLIKDMISSFWSDAWHERLRHEGLRPDDRKEDDIRNIDIKLGVLPRVHGSAVFKRGQTQSLAVITLGSPSDEQRIEDIEGDMTKSFMLHYNFPQFSVGEVGPQRGPGRREIGHGNLAEKAVANIVPPEDKFPYTIRIVSEILESNGSSSMASVCSSSLALMDAGVPIKSHVAGIALGLISAGSQGDKDIILVDIAGEEDHEGDMDLKVAGTKSGINSLQMDTKIEGISVELLKVAFLKAKNARDKILDKMEQVIPAPRENLSPNAPRMYTFFIPKEKIGFVIGPSGKTVRGLQDQTGATISLNDDGKVVVTAVDEKSALEAVEAIKGMTREAKVGEIYSGKVTKTTDFGAFVEIFPGKEGLLHISEIDWKRVENVEDVLKAGDKVEVECINYDPKMGKISLSRKKLLPKPSK